MTVQTSTTKVVARGNGSATVFPFTFQVPNGQNLRLTYIDASGNQTVVNPTLYTVAFGAAFLGGSVTYPLTGSPIATGTQLVIERLVPYTQQTALGGQSGFYPQVVEAALDTLAMQIQQLAAGTGANPLVLTYPVTDINPVNVLPPAAARAQKYLAFDSSGNPVMLAATNFGSDLTSFPVTTGGGITSRTMGAKLSEIISVKDFGALGDGLTDDTAAIQAAINWAIYQNALSQKSLGRVRMPAGVYIISDTLQLGYGTSFSSVVLEGEGMKFAGSTAFCGTAITPTFNDRPAIAIQGGRDSMVRNMSIIGKMVSYVTSNALGSLSGALNGIDDTVAANWVDNTFPAASSSQYAVYCGIAIDPYSGAQPATHYPNVTYPSFLGAVSQYNKNFSSNCAFDNVEISGFVVGVAVQPSNANGNGDYTKLHRCRVINCQVGLSIGNAQSRLVHTLDCSFSTCHTGVSTVSYGQRNGKPTILCTSTEFSAILYWLNCTNLSFGGGPKFIDCYGETIYALGFLGGSAGTCTVSFEQCEFNFNSRHTRGEPQYTLSNSGPGMVSFDGCTFSNLSGDPSRLHFGGNSAQYRFKSCNTLMPTNATSLYEKFVLNATAGITFDQLSTDGAEIQIYSGYGWNLTSGANSGTRYYNSARDGGKRDALVFVYARSVCEVGSYGNPGMGWRAQSGFALNKGALSLSTAGRDVSFDTGLLTQLIISFGFEVGDAVWDDDTKTVFYVHSRTGSAIIMKAQTNYTAAGVLRNAMTNSGNFWTLNCRSYVTGSFLQGDTTSGNPQIINVGTDDGAGFSNSDIAVGDYIAVYTNSANIIPTGAAGNQITARDGVARTLNFNGNLNYTATKVRIPIFWRAAPPNV